MATKDQFRITKDTSARKDTKQPSMHSSLEVAAIRASHEAYVSSMVSGYQQQIKELELERDGDIASLKARLASEKDAATQGHQAAISKAVTEAREESKRHIENLNTNVESLYTENETVHASLKKALAEIGTANKEIHGVRAEHSKRITTLKDTHAQRVAGLQRQLIISPNSWIQIHFVARGCKKRTCFWKFNTTLRDASKELRDDFQQYSYTFTFSRSSDFSRSTLDDRKTLQEVCILALIRYFYH